MVNYGKNKYLLAGIVFLVVIVAGCVQSSPESTPSPVTPSVTSTPASAISTPVSTASEDRNPYWGDEKAIAEGRGIFNSKCKGCHGEDGRGLLSGQPDFRDPSYWAGVDEKSVFNTIAKGRRVMPAWEGTLTRDQIWKVMAYEKSFSEK